METIQQEVIDRSKWGIGPWNDEPDRAEWEHAGMPCLAVRHPRMGHWCGYAAVSPAHPFHGKGYSELESAPDVHGGLTYAAACRGDVCHAPKPGEPDDVWWFGFDCAHAGDFSPSTNQFHGAYPWPVEQYDHEHAMSAESAGDWHVDKYRTLDYVKAETSRLAEQLKASASPVKE